MHGAFFRPLTACSILLALALAVPVYAQTGSVKGKVTDAKNQPVVGAKVTIEAVDGIGRKFVVTSDKKGEFIQIGLQPGQYRITAQKDNLTQSVDRRIGLDMVEVSLSLAPGGAGGATDEERKKMEARIAAVKGNFEAGVVASNAGRYDEAIEKFNAVLAEAPKCTECYTNIAAVHLEQARKQTDAEAQKKHYDLAEGAYKKALEVNPNSPDAYNGLANVYNAQKKFEQAEQASAQAAKLAGTTGGGGSATTVFNQGVISWNAGKIPEAKKAFEEAVRLDPKMADAHYWLGMAGLNEGNLPEAATHFEEYLKLAPTGQYAEQAKGILGQIKK